VVGNIGRGKSQNLLLVGKQPENSSKFEEKASANELESLAHAFAVKKQQIPIEGTIPIFRDLMAYNPGEFNKIPMTYRPERLMSPLRKLFPRSIPVSCLTSLSDNSHHLIHDPSLTQTPSVLLNSGQSEAVDCFVLSIKGSCCKS
jgi:hypothetical protein